jgi:hypothetical protein
VLKVEGEEFASRWIRTEYTFEVKFFNNWVGRNNWVRMFRDLEVQISADTVMFIMLIETPSYKIAPPGLYKSQKWINISLNKITRGRI